MLYSCVMKALLRLYERACSYTEAVEILQKAMASGHKFEASAKPLLTLY